MCGCEAGCGCGGMCEPGCGCEPSCGCGRCGSKGCCIDGMCIGVGDDQSCHTIRVRVPKWQELSIWAACTASKGPTIRDRDGGNFGFQEGINAGFKVPFTSLGYQIGYQAVQSQLNGDENKDIPDSHTQHFTDGRPVSPHAETASKAASPGTCSATIASARTITISSAAS